MRLESIKLSHVQFVLWILIFKFQTYSFAQCTINNTINGPSTVCLNEKINFQTETTPNYLYEWDFCGGDFLNTPTFKNKYIGSPISSPFHFELVYDGSHYVGFMANGGAKNLLRFDFPDGLDQSPVITKVTLINPPAFIDIRSIRIIKEGTDWYGIMSDLFQAKLYRLKFGSSLTNNPTVETLDVPSLNLALDLTVLKDGVDYYVLVLNFGASYISKIKFSSTISAPPEVLPSVNIPGSNAISLSVKKICSSWIGFVALNGSSSVCRINFGGSIGANSATTKVYSGFPGVRGISFEEEADSYYVFASTSNGDLYTLNFGADPLNDPANISSPTSLLTGTNSAWDIEMLKDGTNWHLYFMDYAKAELNHYLFNNPCDASITTSKVSQPATINYAVAGNKKIFVKITDENSNTKLVSKDITVTANIASEPSFTKNSIECINTPVGFDAVVDPTISFYSWSFGDSNIGSGSSVSHQYTSAGIYIANLQITSVNGCNNSVSLPIQVYNPPTANFDLPTNNPLCTNQQVTFANTSAYDAGSTITWDWTIDGQPVSNSKDLQHTFTSVSPQSIKLRASIPGCFSESTQTINSLLAGPQVDFSAADGCESDAITFSNSTIGSVTGYSWNFGDTQTSTNTNESHTYASFGSFDVSLLATTIDGCQNSKTKTVKVYSKPNPNFALSLPPFSCSGTVSKFNDLTPNPTDSNLASWAWDFGDAASGQNTSAVKNAQHTYNAAGGYDVSLTVTTNFNCTATITKTVNIAQTPDATFTNTPACKDLTVQFDAVSGEKSYTWQIGNTYYFFDDPTHVFTVAGNTSVSLIVVGNNNCVASSSKVFSIPVPLNLDFTVQKACNNQNTILTDITYAPDDPIIEYNWKFDELGVSTGSPTAFTFENPGNFNVAMKVTATSGCMYTLDKSVSIVTAPVASFDASPTSGVPPLDVKFTNNSSNASSYLWEFNDNLNTKSQETSPSFIFHDFGDYVVDLTAYNPEGCSSVFSKIIRAGLPVNDLALTAFSITENQDGSLRGIVTLKNNGNVNLENVNLSLNLSGTSIVRENVEGPIEANSTYNYVIGYDILATAQLHYICAEVFLDNDANTSNNELCSNVNVERFYWLSPYPIPAKTELHIEWITKDESPVEIKINDRLGKEVISIKGQSTVGLNKVLIPTDQLQNGIYILVLNATDAKKTQRIAISGN